MVSDRGFPCPSQPPRPQIDEVERPPIETTPLSECASNRREWTQPIPRLPDVVTGASVTWPNHLLIPAVVLSGHRGRPCNLGLLQTGVSLAVGSLEVVDGRLGLSGPAGLFEGASPVTKCPTGSGRGVEVPRSGGSRPTSVNTLRVGGVYHSYGPNLPRRRSAPPAA